ncbi:MAG TPA: DUF998 domain-containing protein [Candidatus Angelobacter sp.]|nr:DUF998 domain-containing protein [Candidatus Angelobacter sp.]
MGKKGIFPVVALSGWIGIVAPVVFLGVLFTEGLLRPGYSPIKQYGSDLGLGWSLWWIYSVDLSIFSIFIFIFADGFRQFFKSLLPWSSLQWCTIILVLTGVGGIIAASISEAIPAGHGLGGILFFNTPPIAQLIMGRELRRVPAWRRYGTYSFINGVLFLILVFPINFLPGILASDFGVTGLLQRIELVGIFGWFVITGRRFLVSA